MEERGDNIDTLGMEGGDLSGPGEIERGSETYGSDYTSTGDEDFKEDDEGEGEENERSIDGKDGEDATQVIEQAMEESEDKSDAEEVDPEVIVDMPMLIQEMLSLTGLRRPHPGTDTPQVISAASAPSSDAPLASDIYGKDGSNRCCLLSTLPSVINLEWLSILRFYPSL